MRRTKKSRRRKLNAETRRLVAYWRDALIEGERSDISVKDMMDLGLEMSLTDAERGQCSAHCLRVLTEKEAELLSDRLSSRDSSPKDCHPEIRVLLCPLWFSQSSRSPGPRHLQLMWVPARLTPDGQLRPPLLGAPWIPRIHLEPPITEDAITVGSAHALNKFARKHSTPEWNAWSGYWDYCEKLAKAVTGSRMSSLEIEDYQLNKTGFITLDRTALGSVSALIRIFDEVEDGRRPPGLLSRFATLKEPRRRDYSRTKRAIARSANRHSGNFGNKFPLALTQRLAVHRLMETPPGDFLCVTGPPGTGKTTLLQSIIASLWVNAIGPSDSRPPVVVACGATNQAVTNIIDSFEKTVDDEQVLASRWLPQVHSFATFCCSATKSKEIEGYQLELRDGTGLSYNLERGDYVGPAKEHFLQRYAQWSGSKLSLRKAVASLRREVFRERQALYRGVLSAKDGTFIEWLQTVLFLRPKIPLGDFFASLSQFDTANRYRAFLLASHYWEGRWFIEAEQDLSRQDLRRSTSPQFRSEPHEWQKRAMITPVFVSTLSMTPRFFASRPNQEEPPIDLLIFDEAGQIPVESGVACACMAKRAIIVGDCAQLEPVWNVQPHIDRANALKHKLMRKDNPESWKELSRRGIAASSNSFMYLAIRSTRWTEQGSYGVFLSEHRRSVPQLVRFANALSYRNRLHPLRPDLKTRLLPPFGYMHVAGTSQQLGSSRYNRLEVELISAWLAKHEAELTSFYGVTPLSAIIAVITPFAAQARRLRQRLRPKYPDMTIGTVNSLQGAERPIIIFSSVYDNTHRGRYFFDLGNNMLNVAVSRAQDTFLVVGDMSIFKPEGGTASSLLARFLFEQPEYELTDIDPIRREAVPEEETRRLSTLKEHQETFWGAFETAKREIVIVSPTISSAAILCDRIADHIRAARRRNVRVLVYTDCYLDSPNGELKPNSAKGRQLLSEAGAEVRIAKGIHNKSLAIDDHTLVEGSFNWLSAVRTVGSPHQKMEVSLRYSGSATRSAISALRDELEHRVGLLAEPHVDLDPDAEEDD